MWRCATSSARRSRGGICAQSLLGADCVGRVPSGALVLSLLIPRAAIELSEPAIVVPMFVASIWL